MAQWPESRPGCIVDDQTCSKEECRCGRGMLSQGVAGYGEPEAVAGFTLLPIYPQIDPEKLWITLDGSER
jgi:hypothetical protein